MELARHDGLDEMHADDKVRLVQTASVVGVGKGPDLAELVGGQFGFEEDGGRLVGGEAAVGWGWAGELEVTGELCDVVLGERRVESRLGEGKSGGWGRRMAFEPRESGWG